LTHGDRTGGPVRNRRSGKWEWGVIGKIRLARGRSRERGGRGRSDVRGGGFSRTFISRSLLGRKKLIGGSKERDSYKQEVWQLRREELTEIRLKGKLRKRKLEMGKRRL